MRAIAVGIIDGILRILIRILADADTRDFASIPEEGPLIIVFNHSTSSKCP